MVQRFIPPSSLVRDQYDYVLVLEGLFDLSQDLNHRDLLPFASPKNSKLHRIRYRIRYLTVQVRVLFVAMDSRQ